MRLYIILVEIEGGINLGLITRLADNFDVEEIRLVNPKLTDEEYELAEIFASHSKHRLKEYRFLKNLDEAIEDLDIVFATSAKATREGSGFRRRYITPMEAVEMAGRYGDKVGIVFGRESTGLTIEEIGKCNLLIYIPTSEKYRALNITHAAAIILYEFYIRREDITSKYIKKKVDKELINRALEYFETLANKVIKDDEYKQKSVYAFKNILYRGRPDYREIKIVLRVLSKLARIFNK